MFSRLYGWVERLALYILAMAALKERYAGRMDMTKASALVKQALTK